MKDIFQNLICGFLTCQIFKVKLVLITLQYLHTSSLFLYQSNKVYIKTTLYGHCVFYLNHFINTDEVKFLVL